MIAHGVPGIDIHQTHDFPAPPSVVFRALTMQLDRWFPAALRLTGPGARLVLLPELGAQLTETGPKGGAIWGHVDRIEPDRRLYFCGSFGVPGLVMGRVQFELEPIGAGCRLQLSHQGIGPVSEDRVERQRAIWREVLGVALRGHLAGVAV